jgi:thioredoxin-like negative regulator of GroEL
MTMTTPYLCAAVVLLGFGLTSTAVVRGSEIPWRTDYNVARKEATEQDKPLLIDFGTENCFYCKKLDATTFRDPQIAGVLKQHFIPLRIDADREPSLAQTLRIQAYPTLLIAAPDGKILAFIEGYLEAPRLQDQLTRALQTSSTPEWMARDYQEASKAIAAGDYGRAITLLKGIGRDGKERGVQVKSRQVLLDLEQQATTQLRLAKQLQDKGQSQESVDALTALMKRYAGSQAADDAGRLLAANADRPVNREAQRASRARALLAEARQEFDSRHYFACLDRCELLASMYDETPEAREARRLSREITQNPEFLRRAADDLGERLAEMYMTLAEAHENRGETKQARVYLEKVVKACTGSAQAEAAIVKLAKLKGETTRQAEFNKME